MMQNHWLSRLLAVSAVLLILTGCGVMPDQHAIRQALGLEQPFAHYDAPAPPTPAGFVLALALNQANAIAYHDTHAGIQGTITDPRAIERVIAVLSGAPRAGATRVTAVHALTLQFQLSRPERTVIVSYNPKQDTLIMYNIPNPAWPEHMVATYSVPPGFSDELDAAIQAAAQP